MFNRHLRALALATLSLGFAATASLSLGLPRLAPAAAATLPSVSLKTSLWDPVVGQPYFLTATASENVSGTPYEIEVYNDTNGTVQQLCSSGTTCIAIMTANNTAGTAFFQGRLVLRSNLAPVAATTELTEEFLPPFTLSLKATNLSPQTGGLVTLTATTNQDIDHTTYYLEIYVNGTQVANCGSGTTCQVEEVEYDPTQVTFLARLANFDGSGAIAFSNPVTVTWQ